MRAWMIGVLALVGCRHEYPLTNYTVEIGDDGAFTLARTDGKLLVSGLRFATGLGDETFEMQVGSYLETGGATEWTPLTPRKGHGHDPLWTFNLEDEKGDVVGVVDVAEPASGFVTWTVQGAGNRVRWEAACTGDDHFAGLGQHAMDVDHVGEAFPLWVGEPGIGKTDTEVPTDDWYLTGTKHATSYPEPFLVRPEPLGLLVDAAARVEVDLCTDADWRVDVWATTTQYILIDGDSPLDIVRTHALLTGPAPTPPTWALAPWNDAVGGAERVHTVATALRAAGAPSSAIWTEDWKGAEQTGWGYHLLPSWTLDETLYPDAAGIDAELEALGFKWLAYFSPFVVADTVEWEEAADLLIQDDAGDPYVFTGVTFEDTSVLDLTRDDARAWAAEKMIAAAEIGFDGWMADYAEWLPTDAHLANADAMEAHNAYPLWWQETNLLAFSGITGSVLDMAYFTRSGWVGTVARTATSWLGDQRTSFDVDDGLPTVVPMSIGAGMSGLAWFGSDIGGYQSVGNPPSTKELWFRWCALGAFSPIMRTHHGAFKDDNWQFDADADTLAHYARYATVHTALYPYLRALGRQATADGTPLVLAPFLAYPDEPWGRTDAYLLGPSLFVSPVMAPSPGGDGVTTVTVTLPAGPTWYDFWTGAVATSGNVTVPMDGIPVYAPAGAILPMFGTVPDTLLADPLPGLRTLADVDGERIIHVYAGAPGSFEEEDGTRYTTDGVATGSGTASATLASGTVTAGGLTLTVAGRAERAYTVQVHAP